MVLGTAFLIVLFIVLKYVLAWITYYNDLDSRLGDSTWRFSYDYPVIGERDISDLDDKDFVRLRRKKNKIVLIMYSIILIMFFGTISLLIMYLMLKYVLAWIGYVNRLDPRLGESTWRWTYDYQVIGERDFSDLDDKDFVRLRRKKNKLVTIMYSIFLIMFVSFMSWLSKFLILILS